jgi:hypothetical protein
MEMMKQTNFLEILLRFGALRALRFCEIQCPRDTSLLFSRSNKLFSCEWILIGAELEPRYL